jgi:MinD superfamily P-loop ATPase
MKIKRTFFAKICVGFREGYTQKVHSLEEVYTICSEYCNKIGLCVSVTPTQFIYSRGEGIADGYEDRCPFN